MHYNSNDKTASPISFSTETDQENIPSPIKKEEEEDHSYIPLIPSPVASLASPNIIKGNSSSIPVLVSTEEREASYPINHDNLLLMLSSCNILPPTLPPMLTENKEYISLFTSAEESIASYNIIQETTSPLHIPVVLNTEARMTSYNIEQGDISNYEEYHISLASSTSHNDEPSLTTREVFEMPGTDNKRYNPDSHLSDNATHITNSIDRSDKDHSSSHDSHKKHHKDKRKSKSKRHHPYSHLSDNATHITNSIDKSDKDHSSSHDSHKKHHKNKRKSKSKRYHPYLSHSTKTTHTTDSIDSSNKDHSSLDYSPTSHHSENDISRSAHHSHHSTKSHHSKSSKSDVLQCKNDEYITGYSPDTFRTYEIFHSIQKVNTIDSISPFDILLTSLGFHMNSFFNIYKILQRNYTKFSPFSKLLPICIDGKIKFCREKYYFHLIIKPIFILSNIINHLNKINFIIKTLSFDMQRFIDHIHSIFGYINPLKKHILPDMNKHYNCYLKAKNEAIQLISQAINKYYIFIGNLDHHINIDIQNMKNISSHITEIDTILEEINYYIINIYKSCQSCVTRISRIYVASTHAYEILKSIEFEEQSQTVGYLKTIYRNLNLCIRYMQFRDIILPQEKMNEKTLKLKYYIPKRSYDYLLTYTIFNERHYSLKEKINSYVSIELQNTISSETSVETPINFIKLAPYLQNSQKSLMTINNITTKIITKNSKLNYFYNIVKLINNLILINKNFYLLEKSLHSTLQKAIKTHDNINDLCYSLNLTVPVQANELSVAINILKIPSIVAEINKIVLNFFIRENNISASNLLYILDNNYIKCDNKKLDVQKIKDDIIDKITNYINESKEEIKKITRLYNTYANSAKEFSQQLISEKDKIKEQISERSSLQNFNKEISTCIDSCQDLPLINEISLEENSLSREHETLLHKIKEMSPMSWEEPLIDKISLK